jgi:translocation and assembly module TamB
MAHSPNPDPSPDPNPNPELEPGNNAGCGPIGCAAAARSRFLALLLLARRGVLLGIWVMAGAIAIALGAGWWWLHERLPLFLSATLSDVLLRPIEVGPLERISPFGLRLGPSALLPRPGDGDRATAAAVEVSFDPWGILRPSNLFGDRVIPIHLRFVGAEADIFQDATGAFVDPRIKSGGEPPPFSLQVASVALEDARVTVIPSARFAGRSRDQSTVVPLRLRQTDGRLRLEDWRDGAPQVLGFEVTTAIAGGGQLRGAGRWDLAAGQLRSRLQGRRLPLAITAQFIPGPLAPSAGTAALQIDGLYDGAAGTWPTLNGTVQLSGVRVTEGLPQPVEILNGALRLRDRAIQIDQMQTAYGPVAGLLTGTVDLAGSELRLDAPLDSALAAGLNLRWRSPDLDGATALAALNVPLPVPLVGRWAIEGRVQGPLQKPRMTAQIDSVAAVKIDRVALAGMSATVAVNSAGMASRDRLTLGNLPNRLREWFPLRTQVTAFRAVPVGGGAIAGTGGATVALTDPKSLAGFALNNLALNGNLERVDLDALAANLGLGQLPVALGRLDGRLAATGSLMDWRGSADLTWLGGAIAASVAGQGDRLGGSATWTNLQLEPLAAALPAATKQFLGTAIAGTVTGTGTLSGRLAQGSVTDLTARLSSQVAGGIAAADLSLINQTWRASGTLTDLPLRSLLPNWSPARPAIATVAATASGNLTEPFEQTLQAQATASLSDFAGGNLTAGATLTSGQWSATAQGDRLSLTALVPEVPGRWSGTATANGPLAALLNPDPTAIAATVRGTLTAGDRGRLLTAKQATYLNRQLPLQIDADWTGQAIALRRVTGPNLQASGTLGVTFANLVPRLGTLNLQTAIANLPLDPLPELAEELGIAIPAALREYRADQPLLAGTAAFRGTVTGRLTDPQPNGTLTIDRLDAAGFAFEPRLIGPIAGGLNRPIRVQLDGTGDRDRLHLTLDRQYLPTSLDVAWQDNRITGQRQGDDFAIAATDIDLDRLRLPPDLTLQLGAPRGTLSANGTVNLKTWTASGTLAIADPGLGVNRFDRLDAQFSYRQNRLSLTQGLLSDGPSRYDLTARLDLIDDPALTGTLTVTDARLQPLLRLARISDFNAIAAWAETLRPPAYASAETVRPLEINTADQTLILQLRRLAEIKALLAVQTRDRCLDSLVPDFDRLDGGFGGAINFSGTLGEGIDARFNLAGENWQWRAPEACVRDQISVQLDRVTLEGDFKDGILALRPFELRSGDTTVAFSGRLGREQDGQLQVTNFPAEILPTLPRIRDLYAQANLPKLAGDLDLTAAIAGTLDDPRARGRILLRDGKLNETPITSASGGFSYSQARLDFGSQFQITGDRPITLAGSLPAPLPFASVQPASDTLSLDANVEDDAIGLLGLVVPQFRWQGGKGKAFLQLRGTLAQPIAIGSVSLDGAIVGLEGLPDPVENLTGRALFTGNRLEVDQITGTLGGGTVAVRGVLPIFDQAALGSEPPLSLQLNDLSLNLRDLYEGGVQGNILLGGTALAPQIGGTLTLVRGRVILPSDPNAAAIAPPGPATSRTVNLPTGDEGGFQPTFADLNIELGRGLQILKLPVINFLAEGTLTLNGRLDAIEPSGRIAVRRGQVNLFATQFFLERGEEQYAEFRPELGLDPYLNVKLVAYVPESPRNPFQTDDSTAQRPGEVAENILGFVDNTRTVRVQASVIGPASEILDRIDLTSRPTRSEGQIFALIGGSLANTVDDGTSGAAAIAGIAGAGLLNTIQSNIANAIGLTDFRIYPTVLSSRRPGRDRRDAETSLGIALEAGIDINRSISASVAQIFSTRDSATRLNLNYRIDGNLIMRGSTDFRGDDRFSIQFERRF